MVDTIIIGGGPAGLSAAISAKQRNNSALIISNDIRKSNLYKAPKIDNYPGLPGISGADLLEDILAHAKNAGADYVVEKVNAILPTGDYFQVGAGSGIFEAKSIIIATGIENSTLFPGEEELLGLGVSYCATCDGMLFRGKRICAVCLGPGADEEADYLASLGCDVIKTKSQNIRINGTQKVTSITIDGEEIICDGVFILRQAIAPHLLLSGLEIAGGYICADFAGKTNIPGVFAAGDCVGAPHQISKAVGQGLVAALSASEYVRGKQGYQ